MNRKSTVYFRILLIVALFATAYACNSTSTDKGPDNQLPLPIIPAQLTAIPDNGSVFLTWDKAEEGALYTAYISNEISGNFKAIASTDKLWTEIRSLSNGTKYYFKIAARNKAGRSALSEPVESVPTPPVDLLNSPTVSLSSIVDRSADITWDVVPKAKVYYVYSSADNITWTLLAQTVKNSYSVKELPYNSTNYFQVKAKNEVGVSTKSTSVTVKITSAEELNTAPASFYAMPSDTALTLFWSKVDNATSYAVYTSTDGVNYNAAGSTKDTNFTIKNLENGKPHKLKVVPMNALGASKSSAIATATPRPLKFFVDRVGSIIATSLSHAIQLEWGATPLALGYNIYISENEDFSNHRLLKSVDAQLPLSTTVDGLENGKEYYFAISATNGDLEGLRSVIVAAIPRDIPLVIGKPNAINMFTGDGFLVVSWSDAEYANQYVVLRSDDNVTFYTIATVTTIYFIDMSLTNGTTYYYKILPKKDKAQGIESDVISGIPTAPPTRPSATASISGGDMGDYIQIFWDNVSTASYYNIYGSKDDSEFTLVATTRDNTYSFNNLESGVKYSYYVKAANDKGESDKSPNIEVTHIKTKYLPQKVYGVSYTFADGLNINWGSANYATSYNVYLAFEGSSFLPIVNTTNIQTVVNFLGMQGKYHLKVVGVNEFGEGDSSDVIDIDINFPMLPPQPVKNLTASGYGRSILLSWQPSFGATEYEIWMRKGDGTQEYYDNYTTTSVTINMLNNGITPLDSDTEYRFQIVASNNLGKSDKSVEVVAKTDYLPTPKDVVGLTAVAFDKQINLSWLVSDYAEYYEIWRGNPLDESSMQRIGNSVYTTYVDVSSGLTNGVNYAYWIYSVNDGRGGNVAKSLVPAKITVSPKEQDLRPATPTISSAKSGKTSLFILIKSVANASSYRVYYKKSSDPISAYVLAGESVSLSFFIDNLTTDTSYNVVATAVNVAGESERSAVATTIATTSNASVPKAPTELSFETTSGSVDILQWKTTGISDQFYIYYSATGGSDYRLYDITYHTAYAFNDSVARGYYKVRRVVNNMISDFSASIRKQ